MKKRIFIAIHYLEIGGAEISLIGLLNSMDYSRYEVDLFVYSHQGELMKLIPPEVNLLPEISKYAQMERPMISVLKGGHVDVVLARLCAKLQFALYARRVKPKDGSAVFQYVANTVTPCLPSLHKLGLYDLAISFLTPHNIVLEKVQSRTKIAWIHTDYSKIDVNASLELPVWNGYDYIASISPDVSRTFLSVFPSLKGKIVEIANILSSAFVRNRASEKTDLSVFKKENINLLSVGRFCYPKNFDNVPDILCRIRKQGVNAYWYLIGYGGDEALIRQRIQEAGMEKYVVILGKKENPYPYIKSCDFYIQPSRYEGNSVTVREAQMLCKPVVVANYPTAASQIQNGKDGIIVPLENAACAEGIVQLIRNPELQNRLIQFLNEHDYGNEREIEKIYRFL
ncbi:glycosyltransferase [Bacteroides sp. ET336]|uniref:glycosyltransferase n=1 Tax=Bacteroides sp. ET336 TaxID=2972459 RepID=UPI0021AC0759|nr:glycosyltransferase [Bacteroides sp. ET336]MCR8893811.1 glycosyltransferase [Bacteroides sp. ET336]MDN0058308.1 glycosyltransferase [Bacteroides caecigallinarum]